VRNHWRVASMSRHITQETFDAAILENIELLEMSPEDAVQEAVQQFEAQVQTLNSRIYRRKYQTCAWPFVVFLDFEYVAFCY